MPSGIIGVIVASFRSISLPVRTTSFSGSVEADTYGRCPFTRISVEGGSA